jgi:hypothetical protein
MSVERTQASVRCVLCHNPDGLTSWSDRKTGVDRLTCATHVLLDAPIHTDISTFEHQLDTLHILQYGDVL